MHKTDYRPDHYFSAWPKFLYIISVKMYMCIMGYLNLVDFPLNQKCIFRGRRFSTCMMSIYIYRYSVKVIKTYGFFFFIIARALTSLGLRQRDWNRRVCFARRYNIIYVCIKEKKRSVYSTERFIACCLSVHAFVRWIFIFYYYNFFPRRRSVLSRPVAAVS